MEKIIIIKEQWKEIFDILVNRWEWHENAVNHLLSREGIFEIKESEK